MRGIAGIPQVTVLSETFKNESLKSVVVLKVLGTSHICFIQRHESINILAHKYLYNNDHDHLSL